MSTDASPLRQALTDLAKSLTHLVEEARLELRERRKQREPSESERPAPRQPPADVLDRITEGW